MGAFWHGTMMVCIYLVIAASIMLICRKIFPIPDELFRKILHFILLGSYIPFVFSFSIWWHAVLCALGLEILIYPLLALAQHLPRFSTFVNERKKGEFKQSLLLAFSMLAVCMAICWGMLGERYMVLACMYAWGVGDAFAALIGKKYGRHKISLKGTDQKKSLEGSAAMLCTSTAAIFIVLMLRGGTALPYCLLTAICGAMAVTLVELYTPGGMDTITCPAAAMAVILPLMTLIGGGI